MSLLENRRPAAITSPGSHSTSVILAAAALGLILVVLLGLRDFSFSDYEAEAKPSIDHLLDGEISPYLDSLPGYAGAVILQSPFAVVGNLFGPDNDLWAWRAQAVPGLALLAAIGVLLGRHVTGTTGGRAGTAWGALTALLIAGAPFGVLALQTGHAEELMITGMAVVAVLLAVRGNVVLAAGVIGLTAAAKPWAVIAVPVVLLAAVDRRTVVRALVACIVAGLVATAPTFVAGGVTKVSTGTHSTTSGIFKPSNVFWFAGRPNPDWTDVSEATSMRMFEPDPAKAGWAQRLEPAWAARVSHPAIVAFAGLLALAFWRRRDRLAGREDLLLLLATVCWWRCLLDTWNVHYYTLPALVALAAWEARRGRPPLFAAAITAAAWTTFELFPASSITPDVHTALYLAWALPLGVAMVVRLLAPAACGRVAKSLTARATSHLPTLARAVGSQPTAATEG